MWRRQEGKSGRRKESYERACWKRIEFYFMIMNVMHIMHPFISMPSIKYSILHAYYNAYLYHWCREQMKYIVAGAIALKGIGGLLFILGSSFGAFLLVCSFFMKSSVSHLISSAQFLSCVFFLHEAFASDDCYSDVVWFLQLWCWWQRVYSTIHQIYTGQCSGFPFFFLLFIFMLNAPNSSSHHNVTSSSCIATIVYQMLLLLAAYGSLRGLVIFYWDEKFHS